MAVMALDNKETFAGLEIDRSETQKSGLFVGIYGTGGSGKTTTIARIVESPRVKRALLVDSEGGSTSVNHLKRQGLDVIHAESWKDIQSVRREQKKGMDDYDAILWDHISEITNLCKMFVAPSGIPEIQQWGKILAEMQEFVREQRRWTIETGKHCLFVAWEEEKQDEHTKLISQRVNLFRGFQTAFPGMVTMLGRLTVVGTKPPYLRKLSFAPNERTDSKFRVAPTEAASSIPQELYLRPDVNFIVDFMDAVCYGEKFPAQKYARKEENENGGR